MRLGLFGGSFDPVHYGHLLLAECCREQCKLDEVWFLPAAMPPHKQARELTPAAQRIEMLELAIGGQASFKVCCAEIERGGVSYTVDTLSALAREDAARELFFLLGADSLDDLPNWREPDRICQLATLVVVGRPGAPRLNFEVLAPLVSAARLEEIRRHHVEMPPMGLSSREIRGRVASGSSIRFRTPRAVEKYVETHQLYRQPDVTGGQAGCRSGEADAQ
jgi:nicotinate-nucleotide adenylyltransferase